MEEENNNMNEVTKEKKGTGILWFIIIVLVILLCGCIYLLVVNNDLNNTNKPEPTEKNNKTKPTETNTEEPLQKVDLADSLVMEVDGMIPYYPCGGIAIELNQKDKSINEFTNLEKLNMILSIYSEPLIKTAADQSDYTFLETELNKYFDSISFLDEYRPAIDSSTTGSNASHSGAKVANDLILPSYLRLSNGNITGTVYGFGCEGPGNNGARLKLAKAEKNAERIVLDYIYYYQELLDYDDSKNDFLYNLYRMEGAQEPIETVEGNKMTEISLDKTKYDTYQFIYNIKDDNRKLEKIKYISAGN